MAQSVLTDVLFESMIEEYSKKLLNRAFYLLSNKEDAEDVVQEVFLSVYNKRDSLRNVQSAEAWLMGILHYKVIDLYKKRYNKSVVNVGLDVYFDKNGEWQSSDVAKDWQEAPESLETLLDNTDFRHSFYDCLDKLPPRSKIAVRLYYLDNQKAIEICRELEITTSSYWKLLQRSRLQLRKCVEVNWFNK